jgi:hypothetical protein
MLQNRAVTDLKDMADVTRIPPRARFGETHVADTPSRLDEVFRRDFGIGLPGDAMVGKEAIKLLGADLLPAHHVYRRLAQDANVRAR